MTCSQFSIENNNNQNVVIDEYLEKRLQEWAEWFLQKTIGTGSLPKETIEYILMTYGFFTRNPGPKSVPINESAEEIEALIREMAKNKKYQKDAEVIRVNYLIQSDNIIKKSRIIGMSPSQFKMRLWMAKRWLAGWLSASRKKSKNKKRVSTS